MSFRTLQHIRTAESTTIGLCLPAGSAFRVWLPSWRLSPRRPLPTLFQTGSAHGIHPSEFSPRNGHLGIPAALTHVPFAARRSMSLATRGPTNDTSFWALLPSRVPRGWAGSLDPVAAGDSLGVRPSRGSNRSACRDLRRGSFCVLSDSADGGHPNRTHLKVSITERLPGSLPNRDPF